MDRRGTRTYPEKLEQPRQFGVRTRDKVLITHHRATRGLGLGEAFPFIDRVAPGLCDVWDESAQGGKPVLCFLGTDPLIVKPNVMGSSPSPNTKIKY
jgi:hypothetical protein